MSFNGHIDGEGEKNEEKQSDQLVMDELELLVVLRLMKKAYEERGVPYHFCREDYKRNKAGQSMNEFCETLCVGPGKNGSFAMVSCCSNQRLQDTPVWGAKSHFHTIPTAEERALLLNEAFRHVEVCEKEKSMRLGQTKNLCSKTLPKLPKHWIDLNARPRIDIGEVVECRYMGRWIRGKVIAHFPEESYTSESTLRLPAPYLVKTHPLHRRLVPFIYVLKDTDDFIHKAVPNITPLTLPSIHKNTTSSNSHKLFHTKNDTSNKSSKNSVKQSSKDSTTPRYNHASNKTVRFTLLANL